MRQARIPQPIPPMGARIRYWLHKQKSTPTELARALGVTQSAVSRWLSDSAQPGRDRLPYLANALGVSLINLLYAKVPKRHRDEAF